MRPADVDRRGPSADGYNEHADLLLLKHDLKLYIDVSVVRPTATSHLSHQAILNRPLTCTRRREADKRKKYDAIARANDYQLIPFVLETYGGIGADASKLLKQLARHSREYSSASFLLHARKRLAVTLHSSNANVSLLAMQQQHLRQHMQAPSNVSRARHARPHDTDQLAARLAPILNSSAAPAAAVGASGSDVDDGDAAFVHGSLINSAGIIVRVDFDALAADTAEPGRIQHDRVVSGAGRDDGGGTAAATNTHDEPD